MNTEIDDIRIKSFIDTLESLIDAEASHSMACKNWLMTILTGFILLCKSFDTMPNYLYLLFPIALFCYLDAFYLTKEAWYRTVYKDFLDKAKDGDFSTAYVIEEEDTLVMIGKAIRKMESPSVWCFYLGIAFACLLLFIIFK